MAGGSVENTSQAGPEELMQIARQRIADCVANKAEELDLGGLQLAEAPDELVAAAERGDLRQLKRLFLGGNSDVRALDRDAVQAERSEFRSLMSDYDIETPQSRILIY